MKNLLLIGAGKWGSNYIHTAHNLPDVNLIVSHKDVWKDSLSNIDGVIIATPSETHIRICEYIMSHHIPVLVEKPLAFSAKEISTIEKYHTPILVNYIQLFTRGYQTIKKVIDCDKITNIVTRGYNKGPIRNHSSMWDYGPHDLSMILDLTQKNPNQIQVEEIKNGQYSLFKILLHFDEFISTSLIGNGGDDGRHRNLSIESDGIKYVYDDTHMPKDHKPPLLNVLETFLQMIDGKKDYRMGLDLSIKITNILSYCQEHLDRHNLK
jgi:predicted dehydrogenase